MTIATARTGLYSTLTTCGPWTPQEVSSCDFGILEQSTGCAIVFTPTGESSIEPLTMSGTNVGITDYAFWNITGELYIRFTGATPPFLSKVWQGIDDIHATIKKDRTLQGNVQHARVKGFTYNINEGFDIGGEDFGVVRFTVEVQDFG